MNQMVYVVQGHPLQPIYYAPLIREAPVRRIEDYHTDVDEYSSQQGSLLG